MIRIRAERPADVALRPVSGGCLVQTPDHPRQDAPALRSVAKREPSDSELEALRFAWLVCKHVKSNAIVLARATGDGSYTTVGVGAGQMSRVDSVKIAVEKAGELAKGAVLASDAFFPFADGPEAAIAAGVTAVQYRDKDATTRRMIEKTRALSDVCRPAGVPLIVNDRLDVALAGGADGVHLGQEDMDPETARRIAGTDFFIGVSVTTVDEVKDAQKAGANYLGANGVFPTGTKNPLGSV